MYRTNVSCNTCWQWLGLPQNRVRRLTHQPRRPRKGFGAGLAHSSSSTLSQCYTLSPELRHAAGRTARRCPGEVTKRWKTTKQRWHEGALHISGVQDDGLHDPVEVGSKASVDDSTAISDHDFAMQADFGLQGLSAFTAPAVEDRTMHDSGNVVNPPEPHADALLTWALGSDRPRRKADSTWSNVRNQEALNGPLPTAATWQTTNTFAEHGLLRNILAGYMRKLHPVLQQRGPNCLLGSSPDVDAKLLEVFSADRRRQLYLRGFDATDIMSWCWILSVDDAALAVRRYLTLSLKWREGTHTRIPDFVLSQLLRAEIIDAQSLKLLLNGVQDNLEYWQAKRHLGQDTQVVLIIRAMRHARRVAIQLFSDIAKLTPLLMPWIEDGMEPGVNESYRRRLTHFYNRFLGLLALPGPKQPFAAVHVQQMAQLEIAQYMQKCTPQIPINREGFRAFLKLQVRHPKTHAEREWALSKGPTWPPWRKDQLGIHATFDYPGRRSRVMKVLRSMAEAGYAPDENEEAARILSGWDTDGSPTIQTRRVFASQPMSWLRGFARKTSTPTDPTSQATDSAYVWARRVEATRTIREAWVCFSTYTSQTQHGEREFEVYQAMLEKLLADTLEHSHGDTLPGDGKEVFREPDWARDTVYLPTEPLSLDELYGQMLNEGIKPRARLLSRLITKAKTLDQGLDYLVDSMMDELKRDCLLHAEKYPWSMIKTYLSGVPLHLLTGFFGLLARSGLEEHQRLRRPTSLSEQSRNGMTKFVSPLDYAVDLLSMSHQKHPPAFNAVVAGIHESLASAARQWRSQPMRRRRRLHELWQRTLDVLEIMRESAVRADMYTFRTIAMISQKVVLRHAVKDLDDRAHIADTVQWIFTEALTNRSVKEEGARKSMKQPRDPSTTLDLPSAREMSHEIPEAADFELLFNVFTLTDRPRWAFDLLVWMGTVKQLLTFPKSSHAAHRRMMCAATVSLRPWLLSGRLDEDQLQQHLQHATVDGQNTCWADMGEVDEYVKDTRPWLRRKQMIEMQYDN